MGETRGWAIIISTWLRENTIPSSGGAILSSSQYKTNNFLINLVSSFVINSPLAPPCGHLWPVLHNTVSRKSIIVHLMVHVNHWNITSGTGSYTLPVNFDLPVRHENSTPVENSFWVSLFDFWYHFCNSHENPRTKGHFSLLNHFFWKKSQNKKNPEF
jgi:hypothetical protein